MSHSDNDKPLDHSYEAFENWAGREVTSGVGDLKDKLFTAGSRAKRSVSALYNRVSRGKQPRP